MCESGHLIVLLLLLSFLTRKTTGEAGFAELSLCIWQENSPERAAGGRRFEGRLIGAVLLKPCSRHYIVKWNTFLRVKTEDPINLHHAERFIPSGSFPS